MLRTMNAANSRECCNTYCRLQPALALSRVKEHCVNTGTSRSLPPRFSFPHLTRVAQSSVLPP
jgi:hypothetical protein